MIFFFTNINEEKKRIFLCRKTRYLIGHSGEESSLEKRDRNSKGKGNWKEKDEDVPDIPDLSSRCF